MARLTKSQKKQIISMVKSGTPVSEVAKELGITTSGVYYVMKTSGVKASSPRAKKEVVQEEIEESEEVSDETDWQAEAQFWLEQYLEVHVENLRLKKK